MRTNKPFQISPETPLQKSWSGEPDPDGGVILDAIIVIDEIAKSETVAHVNKADLRQGLIEAMERGDATIRPNDLALVDTGRIRKAVVERLFKVETFGAPGRRMDGTTFFKSGSVAARAMAHAASHQGEQHASGDSVRHMLAKFRGATVGNASPHRFEVSAHGDGSCLHCGHRETQVGANHLAKSGADPVRTAYAAFAADSSNAQDDMKKAAEELDALVEKLDRE